MQVGAVYVCISMMTMMNLAYDESRIPVTRI